MLKLIYHVLLRILRAVSIKEMQDYVDILVRDHAEDNELYERALAAARETNAEVTQELRNLNERIKKLNGEVDNA